jgi:hypothetical protein
MIITNDSINIRCSVFISWLFDQHQTIIVISSVRTSVNTRHVHVTCEIQFHINLFALSFFLFNLSFFFQSILFTHYNIISRWSFSHSFLMTSRFFCALLLAINHLLMISWIYLLLQWTKTSRSTSYPNCFAWTHDSNLLFKYSNFYTQIINSTTSWVKQSKIISSS